MDSRFGCEVLKVTGHKIGKKETAWKTEKKRKEEEAAQRKMEKIREKHPTGNRFPYQPFFWTFHRRRFRFPITGTRTGYFCGITLIAWDSCHNDNREIIRSFEATAEKSTWTVVFCWKIDDSVYRNATPWMQLSEILSRFISILPFQMSRCDCGLLFQPGPTSIAENNGMWLPNNRDQRDRWTLVVCSVTLACRARKISIVMEMPRHYTLDVILARTDQPWVFSFLIRKIPLATLKLIPCLLILLLPSLFRINGNWFCKEMDEGFDGNRWIKQSN